MKLKIPKGTKELVQITMPCFGEQILIVIMGLISTMIIGQLGKSELSAATMSNTIVNWIQCAYVGLASGSTVVIARMNGDGDKEGIQSAFMQSLQLNLIISITITILLVVFQEAFITLFFGGSDADVAEKIHAYFGICMFSLPATAISNIVCACLRGIGDNKTALYCSTLVNVLNLVLSYIFIFGFSKIPSMGIRGAAIATALARYITAFFVIIFSITRRRHIYPSKIRLGFDRSTVGRILKIGSPSAIEQLIFNGGFVVLQSLLITFGINFQTGYQIGSNINSIICAPSTAIGVAVTTMTSHSLGKEDYKEAMGNVNAVQFLYAVVFSILGAVLFIFSKPLVSLYTNDPAVMESGVFFVRLFTFESFAVGYFQAMQGILKGAGDIRYTLISSFIALWICRILGTWSISKYVSPYIAITIGMSADFYLRAILYHIRVKKGNWLYIRI